LYAFHLSGISIFLPIHAGTHSGTAAKINCISN
jgi:hypothetical protein